MTNDTTTLNGALQELGETLADNISSMGVSASASDGLTTLASKVLQISPQAANTGATNIVQGTFTTANTGNATGTVNLDYNGNGYPIAITIFVKGGAYNNSTGGNTTWYNSVDRYDVGWLSMTKARTTTTPTYTTSGADNQGVIALIYKNSTSTSTSYTRTSSMTANIYTNSSTNAQANTSCIRFKGNGKTLSYYIGNRSSSYIGLARNTEFEYIVIYSE